MRTSNKILVGIFLLPILVTTVLHLTIYARYKSGHYVSMKTVVEERFTKTTLKNISHISLYGLGNCSITPSDSLRLEIEKQPNGHLRYAVKGDTLIIHGDTLLTKPNGSRESKRSYQDVNLFLPLTSSIAADNAEIVVQGSRDSLRAPSYHFSMSNDAHLKVRENNDDSVKTYFNGLTITATGSSGIELTAATRVLDLQLTIVESNFTDNGAIIDKLLINADKLSRLTLQGSNLQKLNMAK